MSSIKFYVEDSFSMFISLLFFWSFLGERGVPDMQKFSFYLCWPDCSQMFSKKSPTFGSRENNKTNHRLSGNQEILCENLAFPAQLRGCDASVTQKTRHILLK